MDSMRLHSLIVILSIIGGTRGGKSRNQPRGTPFEENIKSELICAPDRGHFQEGSCNVCLSCCVHPKDLNGTCMDCYMANCSHTPWPSPEFNKPKIHYSPPCMTFPTWHDIAGAYTHLDGTHHVFFGCSPNLGGWHHAVTDDLVHFHHLPGAPRRIIETYKGMNSFDTPCSGFVIRDDDGTVCAGFRQCTSSSGVGPHPWDVPMELRCAHDHSLTKWGEPEYIFNVSYYRSIPYDPSRPWKDIDGRWYMLVSTDSCNGTSNLVPCEEGGALVLYTSDKVRGDWEQIGTVYEEWRTVLPFSQETKEMVTIEYLGYFENDPYNGTTRVFFNNVGGNGGEINCCAGTTSYTVGSQRPGGVFVPYNDASFYGTSMLDWGAFMVKPNATSRGLYGIFALMGTGSRGYSMSRALGSTRDMVTEPGRRVMYGWLSHDNGAASLSLPRDLSLSPSLFLIQTFSPEIQTLRTTISPLSVLSRSNPTSHVGLRAEIKVEISVFEGGGGIGGVGVLGCGNGDFTIIGVDTGLGLAIIDGRLQGKHSVRAGPLVFSYERPQIKQVEVITIHAYVDHGMIEMIVNNKTAISASVFPSHASCGEIHLYELHSDKDISVTAEVWALNPANNM